MTVIYDPSVPFPDGFSIKTQGVVVIPPGAIGGNHKHPRAEAFYSLGDLTFVYPGEAGEKREISMGPDKDEYKLFMIPPNLPHAVVNKTDKQVVMVEFANEEQHDVEKVELV